MLKKAPGGTSSSVRFGVHVRIGGFSQFSLFQVLLMDSQLHLQPMQNLCCREVCGWVGACIYTFTTTSSASMTTSSMFISLEFITGWFLHDQLWAVGGVVMQEWRWGGRDCSEMCWIWEVYFYLFLCLSVCDFHWKSYSSVIFNLAGGLYDSLPALLRRSQFHLKRTPG